MSKNALLIVTIALGFSCSDIHDAGKAAHDGLAAAHAAADDHALPSEIAGLEIINARRPSADLLTGGQLSEDQMLALKEQGYTRFINLRSAEENGTGWEEEFAAQNGIDFLRIPIAGGADINAANAELLADALSGEDTEQSVVYCGSGNRVGALLALKAHFVDGQEAKEALEFGLDAGLTRLEPVVREALGVTDSDS